MVCRDRPTMGDISFDVRPTAVHFRMALSRSDKEDRTAITSWEVRSMTENTAVPDRFAQTSPYRQTSPGARQAGQP